MATSSSPAEQPRVVAVIGSARLSPPDPRWDDARALGALVAGRGWTLMTGGYGGLMSAAAQGAAEAGGHVIGLPMSGWTGLSPNEWSHELRWSTTYGERMGHLLTCDAVVALHGGVGTLAEAATVWSALQTESRAAALVAVGPEWEFLLAALAGHLVIDARDRSLVSVVADGAAAVAAIERLAVADREGSPRG